MGLINRMKKKAMKEDEYKKVETSEKEVKEAENPLEKLKNQEVKETSEGVEQQPVGQTGEGKPVGQPEEEQEQKVVEVPVFYSRSELDRMTYENNLMLRQVITILKEFQSQNQEE